MELMALALLALTLGARHGLDADHIAAIDGLTRHNADERPRLAACSGALFALGHGSVVLAVALLGTAIGDGWSPPAWLEALGAWISIALLFILGLLNLHAGWTRRGGAGPARPIGLKPALFNSVMRAGHPLGVAGVGAAFAVSLDTVSQTLLLVAAASVGDHQEAGVAVAASFVMGMVLVDGTGGWWAWRLFRQGGSEAERVARRLSILVGCMGIGMALLGMARRYVFPDPSWLDRYDLLLTIALVVLLPLAVVAARRWRRQPWPRET